ncbi:uncharacterized protein LOC6563658 isoform X2 [Drosophila grimshawi]|uniref:uncharacterized protein LOC6563658 isoform X2 n=1 Tax=Drosophila grimshawi TaxID=7222 RepID=UPI000C870A6B|nr:uncharacterized protein LOC6563658 isoform X2 [Drosophila grimshawi]
MDRRCLICGQLPTSSYSYPHDIVEAIKWQGLLNFFVPIEILWHYCCVCEKHIDETGVNVPDKSIFNTNDQRPRVSFNESAAVLYFCDAKTQPNSETHLQRKSDYLHSRDSNEQSSRNPGNDHHFNYIDSGLLNFENMGNLQRAMGNMGDYQEDSKIQNMLPKRHTSGSESSESHLKNFKLCLSSSSSKDLNVASKNFTKGQTENNNFVQLGSSLTFTSGPSCQAWAAKNNLLQDTESSVKQSDFNRIKLNMKCNQLAHQQTKLLEDQQGQRELLKPSEYHQQVQHPQEQLSQRAQNYDQGIHCPSGTRNLKFCCNCKDDKNSPSINTPEGGDGTQQEASMNTVKTKLTLLPCRPTPPVNVLIMVGSTLPTYCSKINFGEKPAQVSVIRVLETDYSREKAIFPDIDEPKFSICRPPDEHQKDADSAQEVLLLEVAQTENNSCAENCGNKCPSRAKVAH